MQLIYEMHSCQKHSDYVTHITVNPEYKRLGHPSRLIGIQSTPSFSSLSSSPLIMKEDVAVIEDM